MENFKITINKSYVYDEVAKTTSYVGAKMMAEDSGAYKRIFTTDDDRMMLERFWAEACSATTEQLKQFIVKVSSHPESHGVELGNNYVAELEMSSSFDTSLTDSIQSSLFSFFVSYIVSKWYKVTNKTEADSYALEATNMMDDVMRKIYHRKKPRRVAV